MKPQHADDQGKDFDVHSLGDRIQTIVDEGIASILPAKQSEFDERFRRDGDMAYGALNTALFQPVRRLLSELGLKAKPRLPGDFQDSREWGNADETHQQRWMWSLILRKDGKAIGAIAVGSHHDHSRFHLPRSPQILSLSATTWAAAKRELGDKLPEFARSQSFRDWYRDYLKENESAEGHADDQAH